MRGDTKVLERLEKQGRRRERAERKIKKAIDRRDLRRGKKRKKQKKAWLLHAVRFAPTEPEADSTTEPPPGARRALRRLLRAVDSEDRRLFHVAAVGGSVERDCHSVLVGRKRLHATLDEAIDQTQITGAWLPGLLPLAQICPSDTESEGCLFKKLGRTAVVAAKAYVLEDGARLYFLYGLSDEQGDKKQPVELKIDRPLYSELQAEAVRLLGCTLQTQQSSSAAR